MAIETLRPNAAGDETSIWYQEPNSTYHWDKVDEATADDAATYVNSAASASYQRDLYNLPAHSVGSGTINFIKVYFRCYCLGGASYGRAKPSIKSDSTVTDGAAVNVGAWATSSQQWNTNPADGGAWSWADIDALQIGVSLADEDETNGTHCTQVYVEVDYTLGGQTYYGAATLSGVGTLTATGEVIIGGEVVVGAARIYTLEIRDSSGNLVNILENAHDISYTQEINAPYSLSFNIPSDDSKEVNVLLSNEYWLRDSAGTIVKKFKLLRKVDTR